jgi:hypothetical protein
MALPPAAARGDRELWDEEIWEEILPNIDSVIPIIGPGCYAVAFNGRRMRVDAYAAERLATQLFPGELGSSPTLNEVVSLHVRRGSRPQSLYPRIQDIVEKAAFEPPEVLRQLAEIRHFNLFVTTAFDPLLESAINAVRFAGEKRAEAISYAPNDVLDLKTGKRGLTRPVVYHLFGRAAAKPYSYAICDEDLLEWLHALQSSEQRPHKLCDELEDSHLLILGSDLSGWAARLFLRSTKQRRLSDRRDFAEILADDRSGKDVELTAFLTAFSSSTKIFPGGDAQAFVGLLLARWRERYGGEEQAQKLAWVPPPADMPEGAIFISYAREDLEAVRVLKAALDAAGLTSWFDLDRLQGGDSFDPKIKDSIRRCALFLAVMSRNTEQRDEGYFHKERRWAIERDAGISDRRQFIYPVVIDNPPDLGTWPPRFREKHYREVPGGVPGPELIADLRLLLSARS